MWSNFVTNSFFHIVVFFARFDVLFDSIVVIAAVKSNVCYTADELWYRADWVVGIVLESISLPEWNVLIESLDDLANAMQGNIGHLYSNKQIVNSLPWFIHCPFSTSLSSYAAK